MAVPKRSCTTASSPEPPRGRRGVALHHEIEVARRRGRSARRGRRRRRSRPRGRPPARRTAAPHRAGRAAGPAGRRGSHGYHRSPCRRRIVPGPGGGSSSGSGSPPCCSSPPARAPTSCSRAATSPTRMSSSAPSRRRPPPRRPPRSARPTSSGRSTATPRPAATTSRPRRRCARRSSARWSWNANSLLEFTPVIAEGKLFVIKNNGGVYAISQRTGKPVWRRDMGQLAASAPAYANGRIYVTILKRDRKSKDGRVAALRAKDGKVIWSKPLPSRTRVLPPVRRRPRLLRLRGRHRLRAARQRRQRRLALQGGRRGQGRARARRRQALLRRLRRPRPRDPRRAAASGCGRWRPTAPRFGTSSGQFYASPAVAYGRVYIGNTDSNVYSFSAATGKLAWRTGTGGYVYASAAVAQVPGGKPTVYVGSYDAASTRSTRRPARCRWKHKAPGRISGAATVVGDIVYFGDLQSRTTTGLGARTGPQGLPLRPRRLQPRRLRRALPLRRRLLLAVAAQAEDGALSARTGTPAAARCCLSSATE